MRNGSHDFVEAVRERSDIVEIIGSDVALRPSGKVLKGLSPFNRETDPSFVVWPESQTWHDFSNGGGRGGDVFSYLMERQGLGFDLADKFGVQRSLIGYHSRRHNWPSRRQEFQKELRTEIHQIRAKARALSIEDAMRILDEYLEKFRAAVESRHVRVDSIGDFNTALRLKQFLLGGADSRQEVQGGITLEAIQARHERWRAQAAALTPEIVGTSGDGSES